MIAAPTKDRWSRDEVAAFSRGALEASGASASVAAIMADAIAAAELDGIPSHGLFYLPTYCQHLKCGKVNPDARIVSEVRGASVTVDADAGFAHPAISLAFERLVPAAREFGVATAAIRKSYNCGVLGYHTEALSRAGLVGIGFTNAPASIAPWGGKKPLVGTNPISVAVPDALGGTAFLIDQSASVVAKSEVMKHDHAGRPIPVGWALDPEGNPTTEPSVGLRGSMVPAGGAKGFGLALFVELMAACLTGANLGKDAAPFSGTAGGPPGTGQFFIAIDPGATSSGLFAERVAAIVSAMKDMEGVRLPGERRFAARNRIVREGIPVSGDLVERVRSIAA